MAQQTLGLHVLHGNFFYEQGCPANPYILPSQKNPLAAEFLRAGTIEMPNPIMRKLNVATGSMDSGR